MLFGVGESSKQAAVALAAADLDNHLVAPPTDGPISVNMLNLLVVWGNQVIILDQIVNFVAPVPTIIISTLPTNSVIVSVQANLQTAITVTGGATRIGIGWNNGLNTAYNKYGQYTTFTKNSKTNKIYSPWETMLVSETWRLTAMGPSGGGIVGTIGAAGQSARIRAVYLNPTPLPNAP